jgi:hypothetical protein
MRNAYPTLHGGNFLSLPCALQLHYYSNQHKSLQACSNFYGFRFWGKIETMSFPNDPYIL